MLAIAWSPDVTAEGGPLSASRTASLRARQRTEAWLRDSRTARVAGLALGLFLLAVLLYVTVVRQLPEPTATLRIPWWVLTVLFGVGEVFVLHIQVRREAQTVSLSEIPLVLGLFFSTPHDFVIGWLVGPLLVFVVHRRQPPIKVGYNLALLAAEACFSVTVFHLIAPDPIRLHPTVWLAAYVAGTAAGWLSTMTTTAVIALYEGGVARRALLTVPGTGALASFAVSTIGLVAVYALSADESAAWLLAMSALILLIGYRAYAMLSERHLSLERLYRFSQVVSQSPEVDGVLRSVLSQAKELLRADHAEITFQSARDDQDGLVVALGNDGLLNRTVLSDTQDQAWWQRVADAGVPTLLPRGTRDERLRAYLQRRRLREAIIAPLRGDAGAVGTITVADRMGNVRTFDEEDVRLLETVANHASMALQNGRLIEALRHEALHDALTGLPNRTLISRRLADAVLNVRRGTCTALAVMIMDLDGFKEVNDTLGHAHGDVLLQEVATRTTAAVGAGGTVARLGGDEFAILLLDVDGDDALQVASRVREALHQPVVIDDVGVEIGASIGVALAPTHGLDASALLKRADLAMYDAKRTGVGLCVYQPSRHAPASPARLALVSELRQGLSSGQLIIHVQPKTLLTTDQVSGVEALARWQHPQHGLLMPDDFIDLAERSGLIRPLTMAVLDAALAAVASWQRLGATMTVAVNLSVRSLTDNDLPADVARLLHEHGVAAERLTLEITETSIMTDPARSIGVLVRLAELGVRLSVDDFGTGYSSLAYLKRLPVHEVKIDRSFVTNMVHDSDDATIVRSIIDLGANLSLDAVAEGVEDEATCDQLRSMGCATAQGYHVSRPMPVDEFPAWLQAYRSTHPSRRTRIALPH